MKKVTRWQRLLLLLLVLVGWRTAQAHVTVSPTRSGSGGRLARPLAPTPKVLPLPGNAKVDGITYLSNGTSVILTLTAPNKDYVYVIGGFNSWAKNDTYLMNKTSTVDTNAATGRWWLQIDGLLPNTQYTYQFVVGKAGAEIKIADPYCEKILDPNNDSAIPNVSPQYPANQTGILSVLNTNQTPYAWSSATTNFQRPKRTDLVIYELLVRDFVGTHSYQTLTDTLKYLQRLGVNAVELLPICEFENNDSWGYNPDFYFAPDKYYGTPDDLRRFIDACHAKGMAVILDMVLNHSCDQSPMVQLYRDAGGPTAANPWYNRVATHPLNVCNDFNHESAYTKYFTKNVIKHWLTNYKVDGYRFDLAKGFTQTNSGTADTQASEASWAAYDASRIAIWKDYYNTITATSSTAYPILELFSEDREQTELANYGLMIWGNMNPYYNQATMGYSANPVWDLSFGYYGASYGGRGWNGPNLVAYMESHDEERLMYKNEQYGNASGSYNVRDVNTGLKRNELAAALFFTQPGPRMVWQFGETGYDISIDQNGRTGDKPLHWEYYQNADRRHLYDTYRALIALKKSQAAISSPTTYSQSLTGAGKIIATTSGSQTIVAFGNVDVANSQTVSFPSTGPWYDYLRGSTTSFYLSSTTLTLPVGTFGVYTRQYVAHPAGLGSLRAAALSTTPAAEASLLQLSLQPNPAADAATVSYALPAAAAATITLQNLLGQTVRTLPAVQQAAGPQAQLLPLTGLAAGTYLVRLQAGPGLQTARLVVQ